VLRIPDDADQCLAIDRLIVEAANRAPVLKNLAEFHSILRCFRSAPREQHAACHCGIPNPCAFSIGNADAMMTRRRVGRRRNEYRKGRCTSQARCGPAPDRVHEEYRVAGQLPFRYLSIGPFWPSTIMGFHDRAIVIQRKISRPVQFETMSEARESLKAWLDQRDGTISEWQLLLLTECCRSSNGLAAWGRCGWCRRPEPQLVAQPAVQTRAAAREYSFAPLLEACHVCYRKTMPPSEMIA
jgi:hypothetical protein